MKVICILSLVAIFTLPFITAFSLKEHTASSTPTHLILPLDKTLRPLGLSFNGRGLPVVFVLDSSTGEFGGVQFEDKDNDGMFTATFIYEIKER